MFEARKRDNVDPQEIQWALNEAARQGMLEILDEEMRLGSLLSDLPEAEAITFIIRKQLNLGKEDDLPTDLTNEEIQRIHATINLSLGGAIAEAFKEAAKQPKLLKAMKTLYTAHKEDRETLDPMLCKRYADVLLDFAEKYHESQNWKKTQSILITAESLVKKVTGSAKPRLFARMDATWGIYLWRCGDYQEAERRFEKANAGVTALLRKHGKDITDPSEVRKNMELQARIMHGFGVLYGELLEDKTRAIQHYERALAIISGLEGTYKNKKMMTGILNSLGVVNHRMALLKPEGRQKYLTEAAGKYEEGLATARDIHFTSMEGWILFNAGEVYALLGEYDRARKYSELSKSIFGRERLNERGMSGVEMLDAIIGLQTERYGEALASINRSIGLRERIGEPRRLADALECRGDILAASGDTERATADYEMANAIYRSISSEAGARKTAEKLGGLGKK